MACHLSASLPSVAQLAKLRSSAPCLYIALLQFHRSRGLGVQECCILLFPPPRYSLGGIAFSAISADILCESHFSPPLNGSVSVARLALVWPLGFQFLGGKGHLGGIISQSGRPGFSECEFAPSSAATKFLSRAWFLPTLFPPQFCGAHPPTTEEEKDRGDGDNCCPTLTPNSQLAS